MPPFDRYEPLWKAVLATPASGYRRNGLGKPSTGLGLDAALELLMEPLESAAGARTALSMRENPTASFLPPSSIAGCALRAYDTPNPYQPREVGYFVPAPPERTPTGPSR
jgi:hypothetical protein